MHAFSNFPCWTQRWNHNMFRNIKSFPQPLNITGCKRKTITFGTLHAFASMLQILECLHAADLHSDHSSSENNYVPWFIPRKSPDLPNSSFAWKPECHSSTQTRHEPRVPQSSFLALATGSRSVPFSLTIPVVWKAKTQHGTNRTGSQPPCCSLQRMDRFSWAGAFSVGLHSGSCQYFVT